MNQQRRAVLSVNQQPAVPKDIRIITEALGHESPESTKIYTQVSFQRTRRIAELFDSPGG